jgi:hypothetical protein
MSKDREKAELGASTLKDFCESWGNDIHARILLEVLFKGLMHEEALFVFGKQKQTGHQVGDNASGRISGDIETPRLEETKSTPTLGKQDPTNYP